MKKNFISHCAKMLAVAMIGVCLMGCDGDSAFINKSLNKANAAINEGNYTAAYAIADDMIAKGPNHHEVRDAGFSLNKKILTNEIAATIDSAEGSGAAMKLILIIKERAQYNKYWASTGGYEKKSEERTMLELAIQLTKAKGDEACAKQLQEMLDNEYKDDILELI